MGTGGAPSIASDTLPPVRAGVGDGGWAGWWRSGSDRIERWLEVERLALPLWGVVLGGFGIALWFWLPGPRAWEAAIVVALAVAAAGVALAGGRFGRGLLWGGALVALGLAGMWLRADWVAAPRLTAAWIGPVSGRVETVELLGSRRLVRAKMSVAGPGLAPGMTARITIDLAHRPPGIEPGAVVAMRVRLTPPPPMALPGTHDFARDAYFAGIGASGRPLGPISVITPGRASGLDPLRQRIEATIDERLPPDQAAIAAALAMGDQNGLGQDDATAMRRSGLAHLLSVSGLHIAAAVAAAMLLTLRTLALSERLALRFNLVLVAGGAGAAAGIFYTVLTGMQVPTVRSCVAALLLLGAIAIGREALSMRLIAAGAAVILLVQPEALVGPSFQLSFAAVMVIVALHDLPRVRAFAAPRDEGWARRFGRSLALLALAGLAVELTLMPLALYHFHKAGIYGVGANLVAIPLTTFVTMPAEALALLLDPLGLAAPLWAVAGWSIEALLWLARTTAAEPGAIATASAMPRLALLLMVGGGLWLMLWRQPQRRWGIVPLIAGAAMVAATPVPALLITGEGKQVALVGDDGVPLLLHGRAGELSRSMMAEASGFDGPPLALDQQPGAVCDRHSCSVDLIRGGRSWRIVATRGSALLDPAALAEACRGAEIFISDRAMASDCRPRWLLLDRTQLRQSGGVALTLSGSPRVESVAARIGEHPWR